MVLPANGPWKLPIDGFEVLQITFAYPIDVVAYGDGGASATIRFETRFDFADHDGFIPWMQLTSLGKNSRYSSPCATIASPQPWRRRPTPRFGSPSRADGDSQRGLMLTTRTGRCQDQGFS
jgi:hypothetical protein